MKWLIIMLSSLLLIGAIMAMNWTTPNKNIAPPSANIHDNFKEYWNDGKAEIARYALQQSRYGAIREGEATLIFVTEPFSKSKQVKLDDYRNEKDRVDVLKLNAVRKFETGIYPYSTMTSVFSPIATGTQALKVTTSVQEWCGQVFMQLNRKGNKLKYASHSYFESEGDEMKSLTGGWTEDELWNLIRFNPELLPTGQVDILPSSLFLRLKHHAPQIVSATAALTKTNNSAFSEAELFQYQVQYTQPTTRTLSIYFDTAFPYTIRGWTEGGRTPSSITTATLTKAIRLDYWSKNGVKDAGLKALLK